MFDVRAASELIMAQIQPGKHCVPKKVILDILDIPCQVQVHMIMGHQRMVNSKKISKIINFTKHF